MRESRRRTGAASEGRSRFPAQERRLPWTLVRQVTRRIPHAWNKALVPLWSRRMFDWTQTKFFTLPMDYNGYIRLNVKGRELEGALSTRRTSSR